MAAPSSPTAIVQRRNLGGALARVAADATAYAHRGARVMFIILTLFEDPTEWSIHEARTEAFFDAVRPAASGAYVNFLEAEGEERIREAYPEATYARLATVKRRYDPDNLFRLNQNIRPAAHG
jgi:FAD/FMN-containing dehydrogenase